MSQIKCFLFCLVGSLKYFQRKHQYLRSRITLLHISPEGHASHPHHPPPTHRSQSSASHYSKHVTHKYRAMCVGILHWGEMVRRTPFYSTDFVPFLSLLRRRIVIDSIRRRRKLSLETLAYLFGK